MELSDTYIEELESRVKAYEEMISDMAAPIIPSIIPQTILVPITGVLLGERFEKIRIKILRYIHKDEVNTAIIDFTDITVDRLENISLTELSHQIEQLTESIKLMGVQPCYVGLTPEMTKEIVLSGIKIKANIYSTFQSALKQLMKDKNIVMTIKDK